MERWQGDWVAGGMVVLVVAGKIVVQEVALELRFELVGLSAHLLLLSELYQRLEQGRFGRNLVHHRPRPRLILLEQGAVQVRTGQESAVSQCELVRMAGREIAFHWVLLENSRRPQSRRVDVDFLLMERHHRLHLLVHKCLPLVKATVLEMELQMVEQKDVKNSLVLRLQPGKAGFGLAHLEPPQR